MIEEEDTVLHLAHKAKAYVDDHRPSIRPVEAYVVDGRQFERQEDAEDRAVELAKLLGAKVEILFGFVPGNRFKVSQIVRPVDDARFRDESFHRDRRKTIEYAHTD